MGVVWVFGWFELYLEIYRHHHVTWPFLLNPQAWWAAAASGPSRPGGWLLTVLTCSALTPPLFGARFLVGLNQLIRRPPMELDLTLQRGNGGFFVLGGAPVVVGLVLSRFKHNDLALEHRELSSGARRP
jgi:hypothetical protein